MESFLPFFALTKSSEIGARGSSFRGSVCSAECNGLSWETQPDPYGPLIGVNLVAFYSLREILSDYNHYSSLPVCHGITINGSQFQGGNVFAEALV
jgi:hypothetical protein